MAKKKSKPAKVRNLVAKYARQYNVATVETDKKKASKKGYRKHKGRDIPFSFPIFSSAPLACHSA